MESEPEKSEIMSDPKHASQPTTKAFASTIIGDSLPEKPGSIIGPYKLLQQIGAGGFGVVYMAEQEKPVRRVVALKIIKPGMDTAQVIARFETERQALALMDHPNIARVLDAGATGFGHPYFVMELVKGMPITEFCDKNHLTPEARLELFVDACHAIQHAHHKGVIHRDIKPSNVLVTLQEGIGAVKVIDFGVAKATAQKLTEKTLFTAYGQMLGTPAYMSPEQAEMTGLDIDTRSDVYSLGVLLYELLTGTTPLEAERLRTAGYAEVQRLIRDEEPPRPSTRLSSLGDSATSTAGNRGLDLKRLVQTLEGDLDWVVMKSLEKDRNRRYDTPAAFADDIDRYLRHEPIAARPPSALYRLKKFTRRNRGAVLAAALIAAALLAGTTVSTWQAIRATRAEAAMDREYQRAESNFTLAQEQAQREASARKRADENAKDASEQRKLALETLYTVIRHVEEKLRDAEGMQGLRKEVLQTALDGLKKVSRSAQTAAFADRSMGVALQRMADVYEQLGQTEDALKLYEQSVTIFEKLAASEPENDWLPWNMAISFDRLGSFSKDFRGDAVAGRDYLERSLRLRERLVGTVRTKEISPAQRHLALTVSYIKLANATMALGAVDSAWTYTNKALQESNALVSQGLNPATAERYQAMSCYFLGQLGAHRGAVEDARQQLRRAIAIRQQAVKDDPSSAAAKRELGAALDALGDLEVEQGNASKALDQYRVAHELYKPLIAKEKDNMEDVWYLAHSYYRLGTASNLKADSSQAAQAWNESLKLREILVKKDPKNVQFRTELMLARARCRQDIEAARDAGELRLRAPKDAEVLIAVAKAYALCIGAVDSRKQPSGAAGHALQKEYRDAAIATLGQAIQLGYADREAVLRNTDLTALRDSPGYQAIVNRLSAR
jgi:serine/threonine protein kinase